MSVQINSSLDEHRSVCE